ncbi:trypsin-like peptidase domain-containing protein [Allobaculum mucilyticum]|uniref:trypsin-like peptidase domain-containing protein n=1 Tax=Allobaculum mucilyticum TaxID=2834459 RepID=UPI001E5DFEE9|nr:trypsin-like peptidase domain-containing protein [Allobaculum mucilyticum]UNT96613.1 trypsin-like peptidase domain-containing protein [Allobaculum mucilyticum]
MVEDIDSNSTEGYLHVFSDIEEESEEEALNNFERWAAEQNDYDSGTYPSSVIGPDDRVKVPNTKIHPYSAVAWLSVERENGTYTNLTGFFISSDTVVTNAHGLYNRETKSWARKVTAYPGLNDHTAYLGSAVATVAVMHPQYLNDTSVNPSYDLAVLRLNKSFGSNVGILPLVTSISANQSIRLLGYPADKAVNGTRYSQYESKGFVLNVSSEVFKHNADTYGGSSGSPVLDNQNRVIGVHSSGDSASVAAANQGVRLTTSKIDWINRARTKFLPVYRVYNQNTSEHFYTIDASEKNGLVNLGWKDEGTAWSTSSSGQAVYRLYNPNASEHHFTSNAQERDALVKAGWKYEGVAWLGY